MNQDLFEGRPVIEFGNDTDRRSFLKYAALVGVGSTLAAALPMTNAFAADTGDLGVLQYALTLEYLEAEFYQKGVAANILGDLQKYIAPIAAHEAAHVTALTATITKLGGTPGAKPTFKFPDGTFTDKATFLKTASTFEEVGVKAYQGQVTLIKDGAILGAAASIAGVEARHAGVLAYLNNTKIAPAPIDGHATMDETLAAVKPFLGA
ncbi:MAG: hypothetical protein NVS9B1_08640 [Candidatus Dormibacteraceae bacterium]